jgi:putative ABC transport system permease protein
MSARTPFRHYLVTALRNLVKHKLYSFINLAGLSVGLTCAIFIGLFLRDELSYERWIPGTADIYRAEITFRAPGRPPSPLATAPFPLLRAMQDQIPEVKAATHLNPESMTVSVGDRRFAETVAVVDPNFFQVIRLPLAQGDPTRVFKEPESIVLSMRTAEKYFGKADPVGKTVTVGGGGFFCDRQDTACLSAVHPVTVTGVIRDLPSNTHLVADLILPNTSLADELPPSYRDQAWTSTDGTYEYVALASGTNPDAVLAKLGPILDRSIPSSSATGGRPGSEYEEVRLTPFRQVHLTSDNYGGMKPPGSWTTVHGFMIIAMLIMLVACFNFMNLATARAALRAREISLRKTVGATRTQLMVQFLGEALLMALMSEVLALALVEALLPRYDAFLGKPITFDYAADWRLLGAITVCAIFTGVLSGIYPALVLSGFRPAVGLKTNTSSQAGSGALRMALVVGQFSVSIGLGVTAIVVFSQIHFARNMELGFNHDGVVVLRGIRELTASATESLARALKANPDIVDVALSNAIPFDLFNVNNLPIRIQGNAQSGLTAHIVNIAPEFPSLYGMRLLAGRLLSAEHGQDVFAAYPFFPPPGPDADAGRNVLINEEAARRLGFSAAQAIGQAIVGGQGQVRIAGVLANSKMDGVRESVLPAVYVDYPDGNTFLSIRVHGDRIPDTLAYIDKTWRSFAPGSAIRRSFLSDTFNEQFKADEKQGAMFVVFVGIALMIACLGLFGVAAFTAERRTQEIGIRKVFGARTRDIVRLLLWQFSIPVLMANVIAWPVAYYYLHRWLESYAYRITLNPLYFVCAGAVALGIAWLTIVGHALRIARASPILALRYE